MQEIIDVLMAETQFAIEEDEVPIACVITHNNIIIASNHNRKIQNTAPADHAEMLCVKDTAYYLKTWNLIDCNLYVTLKPCKMCRGIIKEARIKNVYYILDSINEKNEDDKDIVFHKLNIKNDFFKNKLVNFFKDKR